LDFGFDGTCGVKLFGAETRESFSQQSMFHSCGFGKMAPATATRWGKNQNKVLHELFAGRKANPERLENDYMDGFTKS
jgi:hypothetical protein